MTFCTGAADGAAAAGATACPDGAAPGFAPQPPFRAAVAKTGIARSDTRHNRLIQCIFFSIFNLLSLKTARQVGQKTNPFLNPAIKSDPKNPRHE
jgi:hypothetical protein